jgi:tRNA threonylcarbamoyladenosine modification (KEOPS) complex  Pcc1 subunit
VTEAPRSATITLRYPDRVDGATGTAAAVAACAPDIGAGPEGTVSTISHAGDSVILRVEAQDTASFRAALNAHLRCLSLALSVSARAGDVAPR